MGITTFYEEVEEDLIPVFQLMKDKQINDVLGDLLMNPRVDFEFSVESKYPEYLYEPEEKETSVLSILEEHAGGESTDASLVGKGGKIWKIETDYSQTTVTYGAKHGPFKTNSTTHGSKEEAKQFAIKTIAKKKKEGYKSTTDENAASKLLEKIKESRGSVSGGNNNSEKAEDSAVVGKEGNKSSKASSGLSRTEVGKLKKDQVVAKLKELGVDFDAKDTVAKLKEKLNNHYESSTKEEESEKKEEKEEKEEPASDHGNATKRKLEDSEKEKEEPSAKKQDLKDDNNNATPINEYKDTLGVILKNLDGEELAKVSQTCSLWNEVAGDDSVWKDNYMKSWGTKLNPARLETMNEKVEKKETTWKELFAQQHKWDNHLKKAKIVGLDKTASAVEYVVALACGIPPSDSDGPLDKFLNTKSAGDDVCYGPIYIVKPDAVIKLNEKLQDINPDEAMNEFFKVDKLPDVLGSLCISQDSIENDKTYVLYHLRNYKLFISGCASRKNGFVRHFW